MRDWQPNLSWITPCLAVGGSFPAGRAAHLADALAIRAVIDARLEACDDPQELFRCGIAFLHLPTQDHCALTPEALDAGVAFAGRHLDRDERVLIHCEHGIGRSATLALCVLVDRGLAPLDALALAKDRRALVSPSPAQYEAWRAWLEAHREACGAAWDVPHFDAFKAIAYRHLETA
ncbi:MAG TPA: dual specificity protein phosphatase family protein [Beijerinckiaceae bacterium]|nr:dual specificity protein phosphatase family protein [Beijerinckiaceae bacterium]